MSFNIQERVKRRVSITESTLDGELGDILLMLRNERRSGNLIISFSYGNQVGKKFEHIEPQIKSSVDKSP